MEELKSDEVVQISDAVEGDGSYSQAYAIGYKSIDDALKGGFRFGDMCIITGVSGHGKSLLAYNMALNLAERDYSSLYFSFELTIDNLFAKLVETGAPVKNLKIYTPKFNTSGNIDWIKKKIIEAKEKYNTSFVFIDDADYLSPTKRIFDSSQYRHVVGAICRELKSLAIELEIVIFLMAHVRKLEKGKGIELQDLSESGDLYKKSDFVLAISRNSVKEMVGGVQTIIYTGYSKLRILKNRITGEHPIVDLELTGGRLIAYKETVKDIRDFTNDNEIEVGEDLFNN